METTLASVTGAILSLSFSYVPGLSTWYAGLPGEQKRLVMLAALIVSAGGIYGAACLGYGSGVSCDAIGARSLLALLIQSIVANQATYLLTPK